MTTYVYKSTTGRPVNVEDYVVTVNPGLQSTEQIEALDAYIGSSLTRFDDGVQVSTDNNTYAYGSIDPVSGKLSVHSGSNFLIKSETVDLRDWSGLDLTGNNDNSSILQAAIDQTKFATNSYLGFGCNYRLLLPVGKIAFSTSLVLGQGTWLEGNVAIAGGTELLWEGADGQHAITNYFPPNDSLSYCKLKTLRIYDNRTNPTSGRGINIRRAVNGIIFDNLQVFNFPQEHIYIGAESGKSSDCVALNDIWVSSTKANAKGILLERIDNTASLYNIKSDMQTTPTNDGYVIRTANISNDNCVITIDSVKHETYNRCPTLSFPQSTRGNLSISNIQQRVFSTGGAANAGDIIQFGAKTTGDSYTPSAANIVIDGHLGTTGATANASSEGGGRVILSNISGIHHGDWTGSTGAALTRCVFSGAVTYGYIDQAKLGSGGRVSRDIAGAGIPNTVVYGNVGDTFRSLDATSTKCALWTKKSGAASNVGWYPTSPETQSLVYAASINADINLGNRVSVGALTGNISLVGPTNIPVFGTEVIYELLQDGTGGRTVSYGSLHKGAWPTGSGTAGQKQTLIGRSDGTNIVFTSASGWY